MLTDEWATVGEQGAEMDDPSLVVHKLEGRRKDLVHSHHGWDKCAVDHTVEDRNWVDTLTYEQSGLQV